MEVQPDGSVTVPAGEYILGDPCYAVPDEQWGNLLDSSNYFETPVGQVLGFPVLAFSTAYGDGVYDGSDGIEYGVDAGLIGLVPAGLPGVSRTERSQSVVMFTEPTRCWIDGKDEGHLHFGSITIWTSGEPDEGGACEQCGRGGCDK